MSLKETLRECISLELAGQGEEPLSERQKECKSLDLVCGLQLENTENKQITFLHRSFLMAIMF